MSHRLLRSKDGDRLSFDQSRECWQEASHDGFASGAAGLDNDLGAGTRLETIPAPLTQSQTNTKATLSARSIQWLAFSLNHSELLLSLPSIFCTAHMDK
jgi:hypothetical protein